MFYYMGHFSKFLPPGSTRIGAELNTTGAASGKCGGGAFGGASSGCVQAIGFTSGSDKATVAVLFNRGAAAVEVSVQVGSGAAASWVQVSLPARAIQTLRMKSDDHNETTAEAAADPTLVSTPAGRVQGYLNEESDTLIWRGIPYAQPPTGDLRWRSPLPAKNWSGVKETKAFGADCAQFGPAWVSLAPKDSQAPCRNNIDGCVNWTWSNATSEDCLYVNVHRPAANASKPRPVVVFFAAGAMEWGSANDLENSGASIGAKPGWRNVILVTLNYRKGVRYFLDLLRCPSLILKASLLQIFGFLASDELRARDSRKTAGVYGIQDQTLALQW